MNKLSFFFCVILAISFSMTSCGGDDCENIESKAQELSEAATTYNADQSDDNCQNYVKALEDYIEALGGDCNGQDYSAVIAASQTTIDVLGC
jgi:ABC-type phosphate/phosphonate transport system substrate-binding protein